MEFEEQPGRHKEERTEAEKLEKYKAVSSHVPQEKRAEINQKILWMIDSDSAEQNGITGEDIYNCYTGDGGLHGLQYGDFHNYAEYAEAKREIENGQFFTPAPVCRFIMDCLKLSDTDIIADLTCGAGAFFNFAPVEANLYGCELDTKAFRVAKYLYPKANLTCGDIRTYDPGIRMDYVVGNPPFNLRWWVDGTQILSQLYYCKKAAEVLKPLGIMALVVPCSFLADDFSDSGYIREMEQDFSFLGQFELPRDTFAPMGVKEYRTKVQFWQRRPAEDSRIENWTPNHYTTAMPEYVDPDWINPEWAYNNWVRDAQETFRRNRSHILLEIQRKSDANSEFLYQVKKYLYHIQSHPKLRENYVKCCEYLTRFYNQQQPEDMSWEEWSRVRLTEGKVLAYLRQTLKKQHPKAYRDEIRLVKYDYGIAYKAYSPKMSRRLSEAEKKQTPIHQIVSSGENPEYYGEYASFLRRRQRDYETEQRKFRDMTEDAEIAAYLDAWTVHDAENDEEIHLNVMQKHDINLVLQKRNALLQWEQGSGKTLAGIAVSQRRMEAGGAFCTWVVSNAISIRNNWNVVLPNYGIRSVFMERLSDLDRIERGDFVLVTLNMLSKYRKQIKKWIRRHGEKLALCLDESDEITNPASVRTKAVLDCFRRVRYKLLMTGTSTRNNISEFAPQLELAYNNSANMISWADEIYRYDRKNTDKDGRPILTGESNPWYGQPIPAWRTGYTLFAESHLPEKITVFGVGQKTQDIYNADVLSDILDHFVITRSFEEVSGKEIKHIHQIPVRFAPAEREVYRRAVEEFAEMRSRYFASTGNARKDAMMRLIQQITLLLRISAAPNTVEEYRGGTPVKIEKVMELLAEKSDEIVAIGVRHKAVVDVYAAEIRRRFPDRPLFVVTGSTTTFAQRRKLRSTLKESGNGILLCTQQSLPSSVNFEFVDHVVIPELHYNNARMSQFYFRFIRYNSTHEKHIWFVTYLGSIESNQMQMVLAKEKLNLFMRGQDTNLDDIYERFGVDYDLLSVLMSREADEEGHFHIHWGEQEIA